MPELPEVETVARQLGPSLVGRRVCGLRLLDPLLRTSGRLPPLAGRTIEAVGRSGKRVWIRFSARRTDPPLWLAVHLRMTGRLVFRGPGVRAREPHLRARLRLDEGTLLFSDARRFGTLDWYRTAEELQPGGVEPLDPALTPARLRHLIDGSRQNVKAWLLRQDRLAGLGNLYASEILYAARISPRRSAGSLDARERRRLHAAIRRILTRAILHCGTTFSDFQDARGRTGSYQRYLEVYDREGRPCRRCRSAIRRIVQQQRSTFYCAACQL